MRLLVSVCSLLTLVSAFPQYQGGNTLADIDNSLDIDNHLLQAQVEAEVQQALEGFDDDKDYGNLSRSRRLTCDVFSFQSKWLSPNHAACALKCLGQFWKYKGGRCNNGLCSCTPRRG